MHGFMAELLDDGVDDDEDGNGARSACVCVCVLGSVFNCPMCILPADVMDGEEAGPDSV